MKRQPMGESIHKWCNQKGLMSKIYNGEKTVSWAGGVGKTGQPHVNQWS